MWVDVAEIKFPGKQEDDSADGGEVAVSTCLALGGLEQAVDGFEEAVGLAGLSPGDDAIEMSADHLCHDLHRFDFGAHHVAGPLGEHGAYDVDLLALHDFPQLFLIEPSTGSALGRDLRDERIQIGARLRRQASAIPQKLPAQSLETDIRFLFDAPGLVDGRVGMGDHVEFVEGNPSTGQIVGYALDEGRRHVDGDGLNGRWIATVGSEIGGEGFDRFGILPFGDEQHPALVGIGHQSDVVMPASFRCFVRRQSLDFGEISLLQPQLNVALADGRHLMPGQPDQPGYGGEGHFPAHRHDQRLEEQRKAGKPAGPVGLNLPNTGVRQANARHPDDQVAFVLEEIQMPVALGHGVVRGMRPRNPRYSEAATCHKINVQRQRFLRGVKINPVDVPWRGNTQCGFKKLGSHHVSFSRASNRERNPTRSDAQTVAAFVSMAGCTNALHPAMRQRISRDRASRVRFAGLRPPLTLCLGMLPSRRLAHSKFKRGIFFSLQGSYYNTDGFNAINNPTNSNYNSDDDGFHNGSITGSFSIRPAQGHEIGVNLFSSQGSNKYDSWGFGTPKTNDFKSDQDVSSYSVFSRNVFHPVWTSTLRFGNSIDDSKNYSNGSRTGVFRTSQDQFGWQNDIKLPVGKALLAAEYLRQSVSGSSVDYTVDERTVTSLLAGWTGDIDDHRFQLNLRDDDNSQFGRKTTGSVTYGYQFTPELRAHVAYGTAFRAPTFNELYYPDYGNGNLNPETSSNTEVGFNWASGDHRFFGVVYNNEVSDLIQTGPAPMYAPENISKALLRGASLTYDGRISNWTTGVSLDWLDPRNEGKGANNGNLLVRRARQQMNSYLGRSFGNLEIRGEWQLVGKRYNDVANTQVLGGYGLVNLYADYHLQKDWSVFVRGNNIFNKYYETAGDYSTAGASIFAGIRYQPK